MKLCILFPLAAVRLVEACGIERAHLEPHEIRSSLAKRQEAPTISSLSSNEAILANSVDNTTLEEWSYYYTHGLHVAGTNESMAQWTADRWTENGFQSSLATYYTYLNYPVSHTLTMTYSNGTVYTASLEEAVLPEDSTTSYPNRVPTFHGYSFSGDAEAEFVYVGRGQVVDFERLIALGVQLEGKIAIARYGGAFRGLKVKNAEAYGMIGCLIFTDTADDGNITEANGYAAYPDGPARNPTSVQRGSVLFLSTYPGDPTTPGYPSKQDSPRTDITKVTPRIPSLPLSWKDAQPIIQALDGYGISGEEVNRTSWVGALNATYSTGPAPGTSISFTNIMRSTTTDIWDAIGIINGTHQDEVIVIGNHRDAWIVGGAADPNSGSASMVEMSKAFNELLQTGWKPRRTIVLCSWDAEEYGLLGSTEWVEEYIPWLTTAAVAYLNIDVAVAGPDPAIAATPELHEIAIETMKKVIWPYHGSTNLSMYDVWYSLTKGVVGVLGSGSDYTAFLHNGISALDMTSEGGPEDPIYHYHSDYDSFYWMNKFGDPGYLTHKAMTQYLSLFIYQMASTVIVPFNVVNYGIQMTAYLANLQTLVTGLEATSSETIDLAPLSSAIEHFNSSAAAITELIISTEASLAQGSDPNEVSIINSKLRDFSRGFVSSGGLPDRPFYKHVVFAPGIDTGYAPVTWPGVTEALQAGNWTRAREWVGKSADAVRQAAQILAP